MKTKITTLSSITAVMAMMASPLRLSAQTTSLPAVEVTQVNPEVSGNAPVPATAPPGAFGGVGSGVPDGSAGSSSTAAGGNDAQPFYPSYSTWREGGNRPSAPTLVSLGGMDDAHLGQLNEDLRIMSYLIEKNLLHAFGNMPTYKMGIAMLYQDGSRSVHSLYIEGFGAVFLVKVNFPLVGAPPAPKPDEKAVNNTEWDEARRRLEGGNQGNPNPNWGQQQPAGYASAPPYNAEQVEEMKDELVRALKNAANLRGLSPNDSVVISVEGTGAPLSGDPSQAQTFSPGSAAMMQRYHLSAMPPSGRVENSASFITLRASKSDIDTFSSQQLKFEEFKRKVTISSRLGTRRAGEAEGAATVAPVRPF